jgi:hypothetical protein
MPDFNCQPVTRTAATVTGFPVRFASSRFSNSHDHIDTCAPRQPVAAIWENLDVPVPEDNR